MKKRLNLTIYSVERGITASTTQTQGKQILTHDINEIATCATTNDTVTLTSAIPGLQMTVINDGVEILQIFPASGDDLSAGTNLSTTLATGKSAVFVSYSAHKWVKFSN